MNSNPKHHLPFWEKVACPKCGAAVGIRCYGDIPFARCCKSRYFLARKTDLNLGTVYVPSTPKPKKIHDDGRGRIKHPEGWISGNCLHGRDSICFSIQCSCKCHKGGQGS
jgi:hypothetical protein